MRRELNASVRQEPDSKFKLTGGEFEVSIVEGESNIIHYDGSPLMENGLVKDPEDQTRISGKDLPNNTSYKNDNWIAIGLGTDDATDPDSQSPYRTPFGAIAGGMSYTEIGPTRSALFFDTSFIPPEAEIIEATLELTPAVDNFGDVFEENTEINVWPAEGVQCEVLTLGGEVSVDCTWNTKTGDSQNIDMGIFNFSVPKTEDRWKNDVKVDEVVLPNPLGMIQNSRRSDIPEPNQSFNEQRISESVPLLDEYYGHIGYGIQGGGSIVNVPDINNPSAGHPTFNISLDNFISPTDAEVVSVDVKSIVEHSRTQNGKCNILIRASNWGENTAIATSGDQTDPIFPVSLISSIISEQVNGPPVTTDIDLDGIPDVQSDQVIHSVFQAENYENVTFEWYVETPVEEPLSNLNLTFDGALVEGETITVTPTVDGGNDENTFSVTWYSVSPISGFDPANETPIATGLSYTIASGVGGVGGNRLWVVLEASNPILPSIELISSIGQVAFDGLGTLAVSRVPDVDSVTTQQLTVNVDSTSGVANPTFNYKWYVNNINVDSTYSTLATSNSYTPTVAEGESAIITVVVELKERGGWSTPPVGTASKLWLVSPGVPQIVDKRNGAFRVFTDNVQRNTAGGGPNLKTNSIYLDSPNCLLSNDPQNGRYWTIETPATGPAPPLVYEQAAHVHWQDQLMSNDTTTRTSVITAEGIGGKGIASGVGDVPTDMAIYYPVDNVGWVYYRANRKPLVKTSNGSFIEGTVWSGKNFSGCVINTNPTTNQEAIQYVGWVKVAGDPQGKLHSPTGLLSNEGASLQDWDIIFFKDDIIDQSVTNSQLEQWPTPDLLNMQPPPVEEEEEEEEGGGGGGEAPESSAFVHQALYCPSSSIGNSVEAITIARLGIPNANEVGGRPTWTEADFTINESYLGNRQFRDDTNVSRGTVSSITAQNPAASAYASFCIGNRGEALSDTGEFIGIVMIYREVNGVQKPIAVITSNSKRPDNGNNVIGGPNFTSANYGFSFSWSAQSWGNIGRGTVGNDLFDGDVIVAYEYATKADMENALSEVNTNYGLGWTNNDRTAGDGDQRGRLDGTSWLIPFASETIGSNAPDVLTELNFGLVPPCS